MSEKIQNLNEALTEIFAKIQYRGQETDKVSKEHHLLVDKLAEDFSDTNIEALRNFRRHVGNTIKENIALATEVRDVVDKGAIKLGGQEVKDLNQKLFNALNGLFRICNKLEAILNSDTVREKIGAAIIEKRKRGGSPTKLLQLHAEFTNPPVIPISGVDIDNLHNFAELKSRSSDPRDRSRVELVQLNSSFTELYLRGGVLDDQAAARLKNLKELLERTVHDPSLRLDGIEIGLNNYQKAKEKRDQMLDSTNNAVQATLAG